MNRHFRFIGALALSAVLCLGLTSCKNATAGVTTPPEVQGPVEVKQGDKFLTSGFKIKAEMKSRESLSSDPLIFEVYVDGEGDGNGLVGYRDNVYDIYMVGGEVYVVVSSELTVHLTDVTSHMVPSSLSIAGAEDLKQSGFTLLDGEVISYTGATSEVDIVSRYELSTRNIDPVAILQSNNMTTSDLLKYFFRTVSTTYVEPTQKPEDEPQRQSYYVNSDFGVTILGIRYSIGDYCDPYTYFQESIPQGINSKDEWREDKKVVINYVSYISSDGMSAFMTTDGYVQAINTTSDFSFLDVIKRGMTSQELEPLLGIGLKKDALESFTPLREGLEAKKNGRNYTLTWGDYTVELETGKDKTLESITITNYLDFRS